MNSSTTQQPITKKLAIVIPAYNAGNKIEWVFSRIPAAVDLQVVNYVVVNNGSTDDTAEALARLQQRFANLVVLHHEVNRGYGGAEKTLLQYASKTEAEIIVLLHADGQYAPEEIPRLIEPFETDKADLVQGSRMMEGRTALRGGMPLYKYLSNRFLTAVENFLTLAKLSEYHTGYRAFSREILETLPLEENSDDFLFDNQMIVQALYFGFRMGEISCAARYFPEASTINFTRSVRYGLGVLVTALQFRLQKLRLSHFSIFDPRGRKL